MHRNIPDRQQVLGSPAIPVREQRRIFQMIARLPEMYRQLRELPRQVATLTGAAPARAEANRSIRLSASIRPSCRGRRMFRPGIDVAETGQAGSRDRDCECPVRLSGVDPRSESA